MIHHPNTGVNNTLGRSCFCQNNVSPMPIKAQLLFFNIFSYQKSEFFKTYIKQIFVCRRDTKLREPRKCLLTRLSTAKATNCFLKDKKINNSLDTLRGFSFIILLTK